MEIKVKLSVSGNDAQLAAVKAILAANGGSELVSADKYGFNKYYKVTVAGDDTITDADGNPVEAKEDVVSYMKSKKIILDQTGLNELAVKKGLCSPADRKAKRLTVKEITRSEYSIEHTGFDMQDKKTTYTIIDTRGLCSVLGSFTTQLVLDGDTEEATKANVFQQAVKAGILQEVNLRSEYIAYSAKVENEEG